MKVALGEAVYAAGGPPCTGRGFKWSDEELDAALSGPVAAALFDDEGRDSIEEILRGLPETAFEQDGLRRILAGPRHIEDWRAGEAIAETWLTGHRDCRFPWPDGRDEHKRGSSLPGADLVGLHTRCPRRLSGLRRSQDILRGQVPAGSDVRSYGSQAAA